MIFQRPLLLSISGCRSCSLPRAVRHAGIDPDPRDLRGHGEVDRSISVSTHRSICATVDEIQALREIDHLGDRRRLFRANSCGRREQFRHGFDRRANLP
jgi:hypothetical protein